MSSVAEHGLHEDGILLSDRRAQRSENEGNPSHGRCPGAVNRNGGYGWNCHGLVVVELYQRTTIELTVTFEEFGNISVLHPFGNDAQRERFGRDDSEEREDVGVG